MKILTLNIPIAIDNFVIIANDLQNIYIFRNDIGYVANINHHHELLTIDNSDQVTDEVIDELLKIVRADILTKNYSRVYDCLTSMGNYTKLIAVDFNHKKK